MHQPTNLVTADRLANWVSADWRPKHLHSFVLAFITRPHTYCYPSCIFLFFLRKNSRVLGLARYWVALFPRWFAVPGVLPPHLQWRVIIFSVNYASVCLLWILPACLAKFIEGYVRARVSMGVGREVEISINCPCLYTWTPPLSHPISPSY